MIYISSHCDTICKSVICAFTYISVHGFILRAYPIFCPRNRWITKSLSAWSCPSSVAPRETRICSISLSISSTWDPVNDPFGCQPLGAQNKHAYGFKWCIPIKWPFYVGKIMIITYYSRYNQQILGRANFQTSPYRFGMGLAANHGKPIENPWASWLTRQHGRSWGGLSLIFSWQCWHPFEWVWLLWRPMNRHI